MVWWRLGLSHALLPFMIVVPLDEGEPVAPALVLVVVLHSGAPGEGSSNMEVASNGLSWCNPSWFPTIYELSCQTMEKQLFFSLKGLTL